MKSTFVLLFSMLLTVTVSAQSSVSGTVKDADSGEPLPSATVLVAGTTTGTITDDSGRYVLDGLPPGTHTLTVSYIGYYEATRIVTIRGSDIEANFSLAFTSSALEAMEVFASRAIDRRTPVAFTNIDKVAVERELGSRDVPLVLNTTPSVYSTAQGGGAGDARVNVRGFNQRNVAIMINGVPVNDMENGWVYWSNWDGVGDATTSIQLQRGLSAVNLATPSIGGTLNIITDPANNARQVLVKQEFGNDGFFKSTASVSTGLVNNKFAFTASGVRKTGNGYYDGTWTDAWAYYAAAAWNVNDRHRVDLYAVGAPQRHGQNLYRQNIAAYNHDYARKLFEKEGLESTTIADILEQFPEGGRRWNQNVSAVGSSYSSQQHDGFGNVRRVVSDRINERENFFHKPQINLNHFAQLTDQALLSTVVYYSGGKGGGTGTKGRMEWDYSGPSRVVNYDATIAANMENGTSLGVLRNSHNVQWTIGAISKVTHNVNPSLTVEAGVDWRKAQIEHYRTVRDLLGGAGYQRYDSDFWGEDGRVLQPGDRFDYYNSNTVDWLGGFLQGGYEHGPGFFYGMVGYSAIKYSYMDHFRDDGAGQPFTTATDRIGGAQVKGGASFALNDNLSLFASAGIVSKVPIFDGAIDDVQGVLNPDPRNERFLSLEAGSSFRSPDRKFAGKVSVYHTTWKDRTITRSIVQENGDDGLINIRGLDALHRGLEAELAWQPIDFARVDMAFGVGDWQYLDDVRVLYTPDQSDPATQEQLSLYVKSVKVGDAPQTQAAYALTFYPTRGIYAKVIGRSYGNHFADFDPTGRTVLSQAGKNVWEAPGYSVFDISAGYDIPRRLARTNLRVFANVFNVFDQIFIQDATNNSRFNAYRGNGTGANAADDAEVFLGLPRSFNLGLRATLR